MPQHCVNIYVEKIYKWIIIFCKNRNFKIKNNNKITDIMNSVKVIVYLSKDQNFCMRETHNFYEVDNFILIKEFIQKWQTL